MFERALDSGSRRIVSSESWIEHRIEHVDQKVDEDVGKGEQQDQPLDDGIVAREDRFHDQPAQAGQVEDRLRHHDATDQVGNSNANDGDNRNGSVA